MTRIVFNLKRLLIVIGVACLPVEVWAGQLHIQLITLGDVARQGFAVLGTVVTVLASEQIVRVKIKRLWQQQAEDGVVPIEIAQGMSVGSEHDFKIYGGVRWTDPHKSPIDRRVAGAQSISKIAPGQEIVLVQGSGYEILPADARTLHKLDLFFSSAAMQQYIQTATAETLAADLNDLDMAELAIEAIATRDLLEPKIFLQLSPDRLYKVVWKLGQRLSAQQYDTWIARMTPAVQDKAMRLRLFDLARETILADKVSRPTFLALLNSLDIQDDDQRNEIRWFIRDEARILRETPEQERAKHAIELALTLMAREHPDESDREALRSLLKQLPNREQVNVIRRIAVLVMISPGAKQAKEKFDSDLFNFVIGEVKRLPSPEYLPELAAIDLSHIPSNNQQRVESYAMILDAGLAIARAEPSASAAVYQQLEKWVRKDAVFEPDFVSGIVGGETLEAKRRRWRKTRDDFKQLKPDAP